MKSILHYFESFTKPNLIFSCFEVAFLIQVIKNVANTYFWSDWKYIGFLASIILVDTITGVMASKFGRKENFSSKKLEGFFIKIVLYVCYLISIHVALHFTIEGEKSILFEYFKTVFYCMPIVRELKSIIENFDALGFTIVPKWIRDKINEFTEKNPS